MAGSLPDMGFDHIEAGRPQLGAEVVHGPAICPRDGMREFFDHRTFEEPDKQRASGRECAAEFP
jgi:hypothetical protein